MKLVELDPKFLHFENDREFRCVEMIGDADGVEFLCPKCFIVNGGAAGTHRIICWAPRVPLNVGPQPGRWRLVGTGQADLSLVGSSNSVQVMGGCWAHFFVERGEVRMAGQR